MGGDEGFNKLYLRVFPDVLRNGDAIIQELKVKYGNKFISINSDVVARNHNQPNTIKGIEELFYFGVNSHIENILKEENRTIKKEYLTMKQAKDIAKQIKGYIDGGNRDYEIFILGNDDFSGIRYRVSSHRIDEEPEGFDDYNILFMGDYDIRQNSKKELTTLKDIEESVYKSINTAIHVIFFE